MNIEELARQHDNRAGYKLVDYRRIGLPVFAIRLDAVVEERNQIGLVEEYVLRLVELGIASIDKISAVLGLPRDLVIQVVADCLRYRKIEGHDNSLMLGEGGRKELESLGRIQCKDEQLAVPFDGILRRPYPWDPVSLVRHRELANDGCFEMSPVGGDRPLMSELSVANVDAVLGAWKKSNDRRLVSLRSIHRAPLRFIEALALVYRGAEDAQVQVAFLVDGRLMEEHEQEFVRRGGLKKRAFRELLKGPADPEFASYQERLRKEVAYAKAQQLEKKEASQPPERKQGLLKATSGIPLVQPVPVYEHPKLLREGLASAKERLIIISPWIRAAVVDDQFLSSLKVLLGRKVKVFIGYGLGNSESGGPKDAKALDRLKTLAATYLNFKLVHLGNTHAKVFIVDSARLVISSFNWLSFAGDPSRTFREEWGMLTTERSVIESYAAEILSRLQSA